MARGNAASIVRRRPYRSMPTPTNNCMVPKENANAPANTPSAWGESPNSPRKSTARIVVTVRNAWLIAKPAISAASIAQRLDGCRAGGRADAPGPRASSGMDEEADCGCTLDVGCSGTQMGSSAHCLRGRTLAPSLHVCLRRPCRAGEKYAIHGFKPIRDKR